MGYKSRRTGRYERSNPLAAFTFVDAENVRDITSRLKLEQRDPIPLREKGCGEILENKKGRIIPFICVPDGGYFSLEHDRQNTVEFVSLSMLKIRSDFEPTTTINVRQEIRNHMTSYKIPMPIKGAKYEDKTVFETLSTIVYEELSKERFLFDTYKWILYRKWSDSSTRRRERGIKFRCPYCGTKKTENAFLAYDAEKGECNKCKHLIHVTDYFIGYFRRMGQGDDLKGIPNMYMADMEVLLLLAEIRKLWENESTRSRISDYLFIKDGQLQVRDDDIAPSIVGFIKYAYKKGYTINLVSQEKSGKFYEHIADIKDDIPLNHSIVPPDRYTKEHILQRDEHLDGHIYGSHHNLGIKVYHRFANGQMVILTIPASSRREKAIKQSALIGLDDIITTIEEYGLLGDQIKWIKWAHMNASIKDNARRCLDRNLFHRSVSQ